MPEWEWIWHAEIEPFPSAVMAARHPHSVNLGDVTADDFCERALAIGRPDVLVFGSPCQSYSVAGKRLGLDDPRGNLALIALGIVGRLEPAWFVFENVPGLLSSGDGRDFGLFLRAVDELGYHVAWTVLDAQYFDVAQRRTRVFAVGHARDWRYPAAVLFEPESLCGHPPARGEAGEKAAPTLTAGPVSGGRKYGGDADSVESLVAFGGNNQSGAIDVATACNAHRGRFDFESETLLAHSLRGDGFDASEDGTGRGTPLVPVCYAIGSHAGTADGDAVAFGWNKSSHQSMRVSDTTDPLKASPRSEPAVLQLGIRRLMPTECEKLQGLQPGYTAITHRGKLAKDGPRYKAIGNSMAVPVIRWILNRIDWISQHVPQGGLPL